MAVRGCFDAASKMRPANAIIQNAIEHFDALALLRFEPSWNLPESILCENRHGLDALTPAGFRFVCGRFLLYCLVNPGSETADTFYFYISRATPAFGRSRNLLAELQPQELSVIQLVLSKLLHTGSPGVDIGLVQSAAAVIELCRQP
jgi:hypothetical protein